jgi:hypothetical protein
VAVGLEGSNTRGTARIAHVNGRDPVHVAVAVNVHDNDAANDHVNESDSRSFRIRLEPEPEPEPEPGSFRLPVACRLLPVCSSDRATTTP